MTDLSIGAFEELVSMCSTDELERADRFIFPQDRRAYLAAHGMLRYALTQAEPAVTPGRWNFMVSEHGRPELVHDIASNLRFNLSHCATRVNCIICPELDCGIDVEPAGRRERLVGSGMHFLGSTEREWVASQPDAGREVSLMRFWTLKEAVAKAVGLGLGLPLAELEFELAPMPRLTAAPAPASGPWWLHQALTPDGHVESLAVRTPVAIEVVRHEWPAIRRMRTPTLYQPEPIASRTSDDPFGNKLDEVPLHHARML